MPFQRGKRMAFLEVQHLSKSFGDTVAADAVSFSLERGRVLVLLGPSGSGKSTLLRLIAGLETPDRGSVSLDGRDITPLPPHRRDIAMVFQSYALYPHMTARGNMEFALKVAGMPKEERNRRVEEAAKLLGIERLLDRRPAECSGGERQRIALGRAIVRRPLLFLFDEPLSNLDAALRESLRVELRSLLTSLGATAVYVTHDQSEAMSLGDEVALMREGSIVQIGTPRELFDGPRSLFAALFLGSPRANVLKGECSGGVFRTRGGLALPAPPSLSGPAVLVLRPLYLRPDPAGGLRGPVLSVEYQGGRSVVWFDSPDGPLSAVLDGGELPRPGEEAAFSCPLSRAFWFEPESGRRLH